MPPELSDFKPLTYGKAAPLSKVREWVEIIDEKYGKGSSARDQYDARSGRIVLPITGILRFCDPHNEKDRLEPGS